MRYSSIQTLGTLDGPGVRFVIFVQGCPLRCAYCHNPETWDLLGGDAISVEDMMRKILKYRSYFGEHGGVTVSGGEPLLQAEEVAELFKLCHKNGINTALDTSGCVLSGEVESLLQHTDLVILDIKMTDETQYRKYIGQSLTPIVEFLSVLEQKKIPTWIRQVIIEGINDNAQNIQRLNAIIADKTCVCRVELKPFKKLCLEKYEQMGIKFLLKDYPETTEATISRLNCLQNTQL